MTSMNRGRPIRVGAAGIATRAGAAVALAVLLAGCGAPKLMSLADACVVDNDGNQVAVEGSFSAKTAMTCDNYGGDFRCGVDIDQPAGTRAAGLDIAVGSGADQMDEPPSSYSEDDLRIRADNGALVHTGDRVRASGKVSTGPGVCFVTVDKLEKL